MGQPIPDFVFKAKDLSGFFDRRLFLNTAQVNWLNQKIQP
jgi:hypothetical protein